MIPKLIKHHQNNINQRKRKKITPPHFCNKKMTTTLLWEEKSSINQNQPKKFIETKFRRPKKSPSGLKYIVKSYEGIIERRIITCITRISALIQCQSIETMRNQLKKQTLERSFERETETRREKILFRKKYLFCLEGPICPLLYKYGP